MRTITLTRPMLVDEIARQYLGHERNYKTVYDYNPDLLQKPMWVPSGTTISLPDKSEEAPAKRVRLFS